MGFSKADDEGQGQPAEQALLSGLVAHGHFIPSGVRGIYGRGATYEAVLSGFNRFFSAQTRGDGANFVHFPPVMPRAELERIEYLESFPHLAGLIFSFDGDEAEHLKLVSCLQKGEAYDRAVTMTDVVLCSATCQPLYPTLRGRLPEAGGLHDVNSYCFRREPSDDPIRMQSFRMREHVRLGSPEQVQRWRGEWLIRAQTLFATLGLEVQQVVANDPFFGRGGRMLAANQRQHEFKFELVTPITSDLSPTPIMSFNYHEAHFSHLYGIETHDGVVAHSGCLGIGVERITIALFKRHGFDLRAWPRAVVAHLGLDQPGAIMGSS